MKKFFSKIQVPHLARKLTLDSDDGPAPTQPPPPPDSKDTSTVNMTARPSPAPLPRGLSRGLSRSNQTLASSTGSLPTGSLPRGPLARPANVSLDIPDRASTEGPELIVTAASDVSPPKPPRKISKPGITLKIPDAASMGLPPQFPASYRAYAPGGIINIPLTAGTTIPASTFYQAYPNKASEFMFKQFAGKYQLPILG